MSVSGRGLTMDREIKHVVECTQPWYVRLKLAGSVQYNRVVLWGLFKDKGVDGDKFTYASPMIVEDGVPTEATTFKNFDGTEYRPEFTEDFMELPK